MASCASCAFLTLRVYCRGLSATVSAPKIVRADSRAAWIADAESVVESVRM